MSATEELIVGKREHSFATKEPVIFDESSDLEEGIFSFETDHIMLRRNKDYIALLRTIAILECQQKHALKELDELEKLKDHWLAYPLQLLDKLKAGEDVVPKYSYAVARLPILTTKQKNIDDLNAQVKIERHEQDERNKVRGRIALNKPENFNKLWSLDEQRRLEELLVQYPPEEVESRRYAKIANAMGSRTVQQVCSRVQKYFQKLHMAGLPVPGRKPKNSRIGSQKYRKRSFQRASTFFPHMNVPVEMQDDDYEMDDMFSSISAINPTIPLVAPKIENDAAFCEDTMIGKNTVKEEKLRTLELLDVLRKEIFDSAGYDGDPFASKCCKCLTASVSKKIFFCKTCNCSISTCCDCLIDELFKRSFEHLFHELLFDNWYGDEISTNSPDCD